MFPDGRRVKSVIGGVREVFDDVSRPPLAVFALDVLHGGRLGSGEAGRSSPPAPGPSDRRQHLI